MAAISVIADTTTDLFAVSIDWNDWTSFQVIDGNQPIQNIPIASGSGATYAQKRPGDLEFILAAATRTVHPVNPGADMVLPGSGSNYECILVYGGDGSDTAFTLTGSCSVVGANIPSNGSSPMVFSQVHMTGSYSTIAS